MGNPAWYDTNTNPRLTEVNTKELKKALDGLHSTLVHAEDAWIEASEREKRLVALDGLATEGIAKRYGLEN